MKLTKLLKLCAMLAPLLWLANFTYATVVGKGFFSKPKKAFSYEVKPWYKYDKDSSACREIRIYLEQQQAGEKITGTISCEGKTKEFSTVWPAKNNSFAILLPSNTGIEATKAQLTFTVGQTKFNEMLNIPAKKQWKVYIYPHSHVDIGYTNLQNIVEKLHVRNIDVAIDIANKTKDYPAGAKFVWNPESTWVVASYLKQASAQQKQTFIAAVKKGWIQIDGAHSNLNTSTCSDKELLQVFENSKNITALTGTPITTMVQVDNPGATWGMVQAAAAYGIKGFFSFPNYFDLRNKWENKPFYWKGQDGKSKIFYLQATSYGYGFKAKGRIYGLGKIQALTDEYDRLSTDEPLKNFISPFIFNETAHLESQGSPYDIYAMTWSMADNCLIDADLPEAVKQWNQEFAYPKLIISGTKEILAAYEEKYASIIPTYSGDLSEFWTQGLGADAKSVGLGRIGKEKLSQAETLWSMLNRTGGAPTEQFNQAWENALLSAEHTWGFQDPTAPMASKVEANKAGYFANVEKGADNLINLALQPIKNEQGNGFVVINTLSWNRDGIIILSAAQSKAGDRIVDDQNNGVLSQRLTTGELAFEANQIPAFGSRFYKILPEKVNMGASMVKNHTLNNGLIAVSLDPKNGDINSFIDLKTGWQIIDEKSRFGFNSYNYLPGVRNGSSNSPIGSVTNAKNATISVKENGPLIASLLIHSTAESCNWLTREVKLMKGKPYLELINRVDKIATRKKEGIHFGFPFNVPNGEIKMDIPLGIMTPEKDQIPFTNKNWYTFQRWIDISNEKQGVTWTSIEAPIVEIGDITGTILDGARQADEWIDFQPKSQTLFSWTINNHWDTNFPLQQSGIISTKYVIMPHNSQYNPALANQFGVAQHRPLIAVQANQNPIHKPIIAFNNPKITVVSLKASEDHQALTLKLRSLSPQIEKLNFVWEGKKPKSVDELQVNESGHKKIDKEITIDPYAVKSFRIVF
jgi:alpha-mannosidase